MLLILVTITACENNQTEATNASTDYLSNIMESPDEHPQLTKEEFLEVTNNYLSTNEWILPIEKACFHTSGVNHSAYIVENEFLFSLYVKNTSDGSAEYDICLMHYIDGAAIKSESDPLLFADFLN